jgi:hypothetical protein
LFARIRIPNPKARPTDASALAQARFALAFVVDDLDDDMAPIDRAVALDPSLAAAWCFSGYVRVFLG